MKQALSKNPWLVYFLSILLALSAGFLGSVFTTPAIPTWYAGLVKPMFSPPNWLFAPVWTLLYILMGVAAGMIWLKANPKIQVRHALTVYGIQLLLNFLWSILFFGLQAPLIAFIEIIVLWALILITLLKFWRLSKVAGLLLVPYLAWVSFASLLNFSIWWLN